MKETLKALVRKFGTLEEKIIFAEKLDFYDLLLSSDKQD